ncbi:hypothetical protein Back11_40090 [Paenibacillus baekrokdamisoli]|uniref:Uncharacterized protein n=1 Tax=Paenibacillus baekrokdamisoli TaxID=1712516 RepID=A0A3G9JI38_9BACL|nr:polymer-forming cytoskeletal protein [Paenibacillus baekrokdamisoli]MBB3068294.1 cytoskeletal protein CcmA (bactofilin family) [Paenibacillus baekrokdamisoli]BBH22664.1 hypothetical protein Back11_40090 [Paenibacillus baekrokdamisoli]
MFKIKNRKMNSEIPDTFIGDGTVVEGKIRSAGGVCLEGKLSGDLDCEGDVRIAESGIANSNITAKNVFLAGQITGNVTITGKLTITSTGKLYGNLSAATLSIEEGGLFQGSSTMDHDQISTGLELRSGLERRSGFDRRSAIEGIWMSEERRVHVERRNCEESAASAEQWEESERREGADRRDSADRRNSEDRRDRADRGNNEDRRDRADRGNSENRSTLASIGENDSEMDSEPNESAAPPAISSIRESGRAFMNSINEKSLQVTANEPPTEKEHASNLHAIELTENEEEDNQLSTASSAANVQHPDQNHIQDQIVQIEEHLPPAVDVTINSSNIEEVNEAVLLHKEETVISDIISTVESPLYVESEQLPMTNETMKQEESHSQPLSNNKIYGDPAALLKNW